MEKQKKEVVISTERLNCYGSRVLTSGIDTTQYEKNPVLLYMHQRYGRENMPIGRIENLRLEENQLIGTPVFDMDDDDAKKIESKWDNGFLRMCSPSSEILEWSDSPELIEQGQRRATVTKCKLIEVSIVDIGGNDDALQLQFEQDNKVLNLAEGATSDILPLINNNNQKQNQVEMKSILMELGLADTATSAEAVAAIASLKKTSSPKWKQSSYRLLIVLLMRLLNCEKSLPIKRSISLNWANEWVLRYLMKL